MAEDARSAWLSIEQQPTSFLNYDDNWVGRYYVQETTILGVSFVPSIAYKVNDKLSIGASVNAMYGIQYGTR